MKCSGCSACAAVCQKENCIKIEYNADGFLRPVKDDTVCIHCGLCEKVCPMNAAHGCSLDECELYSAWADPKYYKESLELLKNSKSEFKDVIGLYESNFDRFKRKVKKIIKRMLCA